MQRRNAIVHSLRRVLDGDVQPGVVIDEAWGVEFGSGQYDTLALARVAGHASNNTAD
jgi:hypothetical protein